MQDTDSLPKLQIYRYSNKNNQPYWGKNRTSKQPRNASKRLKTKAFNLKRRIQYLNRGRGKRKLGWFGQAVSGKATMMTRLPPSNPKSLFVLTVETLLLLLFFSSPQPLPPSNLPFFSSLKLKAFPSFSLHHLPLAVIPFLSSHPSYLSHAVPFSPFFLVSSLKPPPKASLLFFLPFFTISQPSRPFIWEPYPLNPRLKGEEEGLVVTIVSSHPIHWAKNPAAISRESIFMPHACAAFFFFKHLIKQQYKNDNLNLNKNAQN